MQLCAVFAPRIQSVLAGRIFAKFTLIFPLVAFNAVFLLAAVNLAMRVFIPEVFPCHLLSIPNYEF